MDLDTDAAVGPTNFFLLSLFSQSDMFEQQADNFVVQHLRLQSILRDSSRLRKSSQGHAIDRISLVQRHRRTHGRYRHRLHRSQFRI